MSLGGDLVIIALIDTTLQTGMMPPAQKKLRAEGLKYASNNPYLGLNGQNSHAALGAIQTLVAGTL